MGAKKSFPLFGLETLYISVALLLVGNGLQNVFLTLRADMEGFSLPVIGTMASMYFAGFVLGCFVCPKYVARVGHIRTFASLASLAASMALLHSLWIEPIPWILLRSITGFCLAGLYVVIESWINEFAENQNRGRIISQYRVTDLCGTIAGQFFLLSADPGDFRLFTLLAIFITLSLVPISLTRVRSPHPIEETPILFKKSMRELWSKSPLGVLGCFVSGFVNASFWALAPIFVTQKLGTFKMLPLFMFTYLIGGTVSQWPVGWLSDRIDRRHVLLGISLFAALSALMINISVEAQGWLHQSLWIFLVIFGACSIPVYSISIAHANDQSHGMPFVRMSSLLLLTSSAGSISGPVLTSTLANHYGSPTLFLVIMALQGAMVVYSLYRLFIRPPVPEDEKIDWVSYPRTTPTIFQLDPHEGEHDNTADAAQGKKS